MPGAKKLLHSKCYSYQSIFSVKQGMVITSKIDKRWRVRKGRQFDKAIVANGNATGDCIDRLKGGSERLVESGDHEFRVNRGCVTCPHPSTTLRNSVQKRK